MEKIHIVKALAQGMLIGEVKIPLGGVCLAHKKEFSDYLLEKKADSEVSEEINSKLKGANQQTQGGANQQMANQFGQSPQDFQQLLNQLKSQAQTQQQQTDGKVNQAIQQAINALTQAQAEHSGQPGFLSNESVA